MMISTETLDRVAHAQDGVLDALRRENAELRARIAFYERTQLPPLTTRQRTLFNFIARTIAEQEVAPSFEEMKDHMGWRSLASVHEMLVLLERKGWIRRGYNERRAIQIAPAAL